MCQLEHHQGRFSSLRGVWLLSVIVFLWIAPSAAEPFSPAKVNPEASQNFIVSTNEGLVSVKATEASLEDVIESIGQALSIEVEAQVGDHEKVTVEFDDLPIDPTIKRLSGNYAYTSDSDGAKLSKSKGAASPAGGSVAETNRQEAGRRASSPELFKFEFDPSEYIGGRNHGPQK